MATNFRIGQIVEVVFPTDGMDFHEGDMGTVVGTPYRFSLDQHNTRIEVLFHSNGERRYPLTSILRPYENPMDRPNRSQGAGETVRVLSTVINVSLPHAFEEVQRELERAHMEKEDFRAKCFSPYPQYPDAHPSRRGVKTWRQYARERRDLADDLAEQNTKLEIKIDNAREMAKDSLEHSSRNMMYLAIENIINVLVNTEVEDSEPSASSSQSE